jgi:putative ATP-binding cassette transporter
MRLPQFDLERGRPLVLTGPSGVGKSTLFRVLAEIWPFARGRLTVPKGKIVFLPQRPYMPLGTLRQAVTYPQPDNRVDDDFVRETLERVGLAGLVPQLDVVNNWTQLLSGGELQRVALARALVNKPDWLFMDEALSALDEEAGTALLHLVQHRLPSTQIVLITHSQIIADAFPRHARVERDGSGTADIIAAEAFAHGI